MWIYSQALGSMYRRDSDFGSATLVATGYAGHGVGLNNPVMQCQEDIGPLPRGLYHISAPVVGPTDYALPLIAEIGTNMCSPPRSGFYIHGDYVHKEVPRNTYAASKGCIVLPLAIRKTIWESGDTILTVIAQGVE